VPSAGLPLFTCDAHYFLPHWVRACGGLCYVSRPPPHYAGKATARRGCGSSELRDAPRRNHRPLDHSTAAMASSIEQSPFYQQMRAKGATIVTGTMACPSWLHTPRESSAKSCRCTQVRPGLLHWQLCWRVPQKHVRQPSANPTQASPALTASTTLALTRLTSPSTPTASPLRRPRRARTSSCTRRWSMSSAPSRPRMPPRCSTRPGQRRRRARHSRSRTGWSTSSSRTRTT
jgi:hypothetical protein